MCIFLDVCKCVYCLCEEVVDLNEGQLYGVKIATRTQKKMRVLGRSKFEFVVFTCSLSISI